MTDEELYAIQEEFIKEYFCKEPFRQYVNMCCIDTLANPPYIKVGISRRLSDNLKIPAEFKGVKVKVEIIGDILLQ